MEIAGIIPGAGTGSRLGADIPKALVHLRGEPLILRAVQGMEQAGILQIVVAAPAEYRQDFLRVLADCVADISVVTGGATRQASVARALRAIDTEYVLIHDAARPLTPVSVIENVMQELQRGAEAVIPVVPVVDTVKQAKVEEKQEVVAATLVRDSLRAVQTPQGFRSDLLRQAHLAGEKRQVANGAVDDSLLVEELGARVVMVPGAAEALKITTPFDLAVAELIAAQRSE